MHTGEKLVSVCRNKKEAAPFDAASCYIYQFCKNAVYNSLILIFLNQTAWPWSWSPI